MATRFASTPSPCAITVCVLVLCSCVFQLARLAEIKRLDALRDLELMQESLKLTVPEEAGKSGMIIKQAFYGAIPGEPDGLVPLVLQDLGDSICVTQQLQYLVEDSKLVIPSGPSKVLLDGFYDPVEGFAKRLLIRYEFRGLFHQVIVDDFDELKIPRRCKWLRRWAGRPGRPVATDADTTLMTCLNGAQLTLYLVRKRGFEASRVASIAFSTCLLTMWLLSCPTKIGSCPQSLEGRQSRRSTSAAPESRHAGERAAHFDSVVKAWGFLYRRWRGCARV